MAYYFISQDEEGNDRDDLEPLEISFIGDKQIQKFVKKHPTVILFEAELSTGIDGVWAVYSYDYAPSIDAVFLNERDAASYCNGNHRYYLAFLPWGVTLEDQLAKNKLPLLEKDL